MKESDPKLTALIHKTVQVTEEDHEAASRFSMEMQDRMHNHLTAREAHQLLQSVEHVPAEASAHIKAISDMHRNSAKAHWDKHPEHHGSGYVVGDGDTWPDFYDSWKELHHENSRLDNEHWTHEN
jgi:hypothetical protein